MGTCSSGSTSGEAATRSSGPSRRRGAPAAAVEVLEHLLGNLLREPRSDKFRRVRLGNTWIKEPVTDREDMVELLEAVGFRVRDESGELFMVIDEVPSDARLNGGRRAVFLLERAHHSSPCSGGG
ncbi:plant UBX domain-containing protein 2 [Panicum miliaceum]|uniref:Plant UBX domain-containing protein 2 n=1 Tax=Panicum miliaceum TaxID=4540 RepID=A0A3L6TRE3_PANMI|nr:plant UBX domain-containing protein 2 [Panicum miliaceum]